MKELGLVIPEAGDVIKFGEFNYSCYKDTANSKHFHNSSFREVLKENKDKFPFIEYADEFEIVHNLNFMSKNNCVSLLNSSHMMQNDCIPMALMTIPADLSLAQKESLNSIKDTINYFGDQLFVYVMDKDQVVSEYNCASDFFSDYVIDEIENKVSSMAMK